MLRVESPLIPGSDVALKLAEAIGKALMRSDKKAESPGVGGSRQHLQLPSQGRIEFKMHKPEANSDQAS